jgi:hypothetical protein
MNEFTTLKKIIAAEKKFLEIIYVSIAGNLAEIRTM